MDSQNEHNSAEVSANDKAHEEYVNVYKDKGLHERLMAWARENGLDPADISNRFRPTINGTELTYARFIRNSGGYAVTDPAEPNQVATETVTVTLTVAPDADIAALLAPRCTECGR